MNRSQSLLCPILLLVLLALASAGSVAVETAGEGAAPSDPRWQPRPYVQLEHPEWAGDAVLYQLNTRQFTSEGTFAAAQRELPRLKALGANIIWLMPIHPIGDLKRKGTLGSPYAVKDYYGVNPEFGTLADLKAFIAAAHALDLKVILDWVANHTAWDNPLVEAHPDWYERDWNGDFRPTPWWDWSDIIDLDYDRPEVWRYMADAMKYWVAEVGVDGFRCDVAGYVPLAFWEGVRAELDAIRPVFMLAEWESRDVHARAFDASYAWSWKDAVAAIAAGEADVGALFGYYSANESAWPRDAYRMVYVENHDQNAWEATQFERYGDALEAVIVLQVTGEGMPLIHNGQEAGNEKRLAFFEKDPIVWREHPVGALYRKLFALKHENRALWNGASGGRMQPIENSEPSKVLSFLRRRDGAAVLVAINFSPESRTVALLEGPHAGSYEEYFTGNPATFGDRTEIDLPAWGYRVYVQ